MKRFWIYRRVLILALIVLSLSGCVKTGGNTITFNYTTGNETGLTGNERIYVRYSDGSVSGGNLVSGGSVTVETYSGKTIVGGYISDGDTSWVPQHTYSGFPVDSVNFTEPSQPVTAQKPATTPIFAEMGQAIVDSSNSNYSDVTFSVYGTDGKKVSGQAEVFALSDLTTFYNNDTLDQNQPPFYTRTDSVTQGISSNTVNGDVTFVIQGTPADMETVPLKLFSGQRLLYDSNLSQLQASTNQVTLGLSGTKNVSLTASFKDSTPADNVTATGFWTTDDSGIVTVNNGTLTAVGTGPTTVHFYYGGKKADISVTVNPPVTLTTLNITPASASLTVGESVYGKLTATYSDSNSSDVTTQANWTSSNDQVASVDAQGHITAVSEGSATITGSFDGLSKTVSVTVTSQPSVLPVITSLSANPATVYITAGSSQSTVVTATYNDSSTSQVTQLLTWTSANDNVATVVNGIITGKAAGETTITGAIGAVHVDIRVIVMSSHRKSSGGSTASTLTPETTTTPTNQETPAPTPTQTQADQGTSMFKVDGEKVVNRIKGRVDAAKNSNALTNFNDISAHWAAKTVNTFVKLGFIQGYADGSFHPDGKITRAEFASILVRVFDIGAGQQQGLTLNDVNGHWAQKEISTLVSADIINGYEDATFKPDNTINRAEMVTMLSRIINIDQLKQGNANVSFSDISSSFAAKEIREAAAAGIVSGEGSGKFEPQNVSTRAEALTMILNTLNLNPQIKSMLDTLN